MSSCRAPTPRPSRQLAPGRTRSGITLPSTHATTPPASDAAALSPWRSRPTATSRMAPRSATSAAAGSSATAIVASAAPATRAAPLKPSPRPIGIDERTHNGSAMAAAVRRGKRGRRWVVPVDRLGRLGRVTEPMSSARSSAMPSTSNPAPRLADDGGNANGGHCGVGPTTPGPGLQARLSALRHRSLGGQLEAGLEIVGQPSHHQTARSVEHDDVAVRTRLAGEHAPHDGGVLLGAPPRQIVGSRRGDAESDSGRPRTRRRRRLAERAPATGPSVVSSSSPAPWTTHASLNPGRCSVSTIGTANAGSATPMTWRWTRRDRHRAEQVERRGDADSRRGGPAKRNAGWKGGRNRSRCPPRRRSSDALGVELDRDPSASRTSAAPHFDDAERLPCLHTGTPAPAMTMAAIVDTLIEWGDRRPCRRCRHNSAAPRRTVTHRRLCSVAASPCQLSTVSPWLAADEEAHDLEPSRVPTEDRRHHRSGGRSVDRRRRSGST